jgi:glycosyltransferase involved in cell wall biosynthesis
MPDQLRTLVVTSALVPSQLHTWQAASELPGIDLHVAGSLRVDTSESYPGPLGIPCWGTVHPLGATGIPRRGRLWWRLDGLEALIGHLRPDVVHVHSEAWGLLVSQALGAGAPTVAHGAENVSLSHGGWAEARIRRLVATRNARRLAGYASWNQAGIAVLRANGLRADAPVAVAPAIAPDPAPFAVPTPRPSRRGPRRIAYVGRLVPEKGVQWLISCLAGLDEVVLRIIGTGSYESELRRQVRRSSVATEWAGEVTAPELPFALADVDVVVVPSLTSPGWSEQFGRVVCEAMYAGIAVVASDSGALPEVVGDAGVVVPELDHRRLHDELRSLVSDDDHCRQLGERGRTWSLEQLAPAAAATNLGHLWREVAAS